MNFSLFIAKRYLFSKKSTHAINIISAVSAVGIGIATMAIVVIMSVFNGFQDIVSTLFSAFDAELKIIPIEGKTIAADNEKLSKIKQFPQIEVATECVEDEALAVFGEKQAMVRVKGVDDNFTKLTNIDSILIGDGDFKLHAANLQYGVLGAGVALNLGTGIAWNGFLKIFAPIKEGQIDISNATSAFEIDSLISPNVVFNVKQPTYDSKYIISSIDFARNIFGQQGMISYLEIKLKPGTNIKSIKNEMQSVLGKEFKVLDRYEQHSDTYKIMNIEKLVAYAFLTFILIIACFNIITSVSMLIIDKQKDILTLKSMGATTKQITNIFLLEGWLINIIGSIIGLCVGLLLCFLQQEFGIVGLGDSSGTFIIDSYPVSIYLSDIILIFITVVLIGFLAVLYPIRNLKKQLET